MTYSPMPTARKNTITWAAARALAILVYEGSLNPLLVSGRLRDFIGETCPPATWAWAHTRAMKVYSRKLAKLQEK